MSCASGTSVAEMVLAWSFSAESAVFYRKKFIHKLLILQDTAHENADAVSQNKLAVRKHTDDVLCVQTPFWERIQNVRNTELDTLWKSFRVQTFNSFLLNAIPTFVSVGTFTVYVLLGNKLTAAKAFTSLSLFSVS